MTHDLPSNGVYAGNPAHYICTFDSYIEKEKLKLSKLPSYDITFTYQGNVTSEKKLKMKNELHRYGGGYIP